MLLTAEDASDKLLPAGNLREPLRALRRANVIVLRADEAEALQPVLCRVRGTEREGKQWIIQRRSAVMENGQAERPLAFCGLARPDDFRRSLQELHIQGAGFVALRDHQRYSLEILHHLCQRAREARADGFVTTAKDAVKLTEPMRQQLRTVGPLSVCDVSVSLTDEAGCVRDVLDLVRAEWTRRLQR